MFISLSSTRIQNFSNCMPFLFCFLSHSVAVAAWSGIQMLHFELFLSSGAQEPVQLPDNICLVQAAGKKKYIYDEAQKAETVLSAVIYIYILGSHPKRIIIPVPFHSKAFLLLYKFETSCALLGRLSKGFFAISGASNFKHSLFMTLYRLDLLTMGELPHRVSYFVSSLL